MECKQCGKEIKPHDAVIRLKTGFISEDGKSLKRVQRVQYEHHHCSDNSVGFVGPINHSKDNDGGGESP